MLLANGGEGVDQSSKRILGLMFSSRRCERLSGGQPVCGVSMVRCSVQKEQREEARRRGHDCKEGVKMIKEKTSNNRQLTSS